MKHQRVSVLRDHALTGAAPIRVEVTGPSAVAKTIRVAVVSRQRVIREALTAVLSSERGIKIVGSTAPESRVSELVHETRPNVVLVDLSPTPGQEDLDLVRTIQDANHEPKVLMLTAMQDDAVICRALTAGAQGYVSKEAGISELRKAILGVYGGDVWVERRVLLRWLRREVSTEVRGGDGPARMKEPLTAREQEVLRLVAFGGTNKEIAQALFISDKTVKTHLHSIFRKLQVTGRLQAVMYAVRTGLQCCGYAIWPLLGLS